MITSIFFTRVYIPNSLVAGKVFLLMGVFLWHRHRSPVVSFQTLAISAQRSSAANGIFQLVVPFFGGLLPLFPMVECCRQEVGRHLHQQLHLSESCHHGTGQCVVSG